MRRNTLLMAPTLQRGSLSSDIPRPNTAGAVKAAFPRGSMGTIKTENLNYQNIIYNTPLSLQWPLCMNRSHLIDID